MKISNAMTLFIWPSPSVGYEHSYASFHFKIDRHFSLLPAYILLISYKNDKVFSLSNTDICGLTAYVTSGGRDETTPLWRNRPEAKKNVSKRYAYL
jgi:hypothetical protein